MVQPIRAEHAIILHPVLVCWLNSHTLMSPQQRQEVGPLWVSDSGSTKLSPRPEVETPPKHTILSTVPSLALCRFGKAPDVQAGSTVFTWYFTTITTKKQTGTRK